MYNIFRGCNNLMSLDISSFKINTNQINGMFEDCFSLSKIAVPCGLKATIALPAQDGKIWTTPDGTEINELPKGLETSIEIVRQENFGRKRIYGGRKRYAHFRSMAIACKADGSRPCYERTGSYKRQQQQSGCLHGLCQV